MRRVVESKGISARRGKRMLRSDNEAPVSSAACTNATSVGSPNHSCPAVRDTFEQRAAASNNVVTSLFEDGNADAPPGVTTAVARILFSVSVPVLSEQMTVTAPSVSIAL